MGTFMHPCETDMVFRSTNAKVPKFNSFVYFQNKQAVGKVDEIFGAINEMARPHSLTPSALLLRLFGPPE